MHSLWSAVRWTICSYQLKRRCGSPLQQYSCSLYHMSCMECCSNTAWCTACTLLSSSSLVTHRLLLPFLQMCRCAAGIHRVLCGPAQHEPPGAHPPGCSVCDPAEAGRWRLQVDGSDAFPLPPWQLQWSCGTFHTPGECCGAYSWLALECAPDIDEHATGPCPVPSSQSHASHQDCRPSQQC